MWRVTTFATCFWENHCISFWPFSCWSLSRASPLRYITVGIQLPQYSWLALRKAFQMRKDVAAKWKYTATVVLLKPLHWPKKRVIIRFLNQLSPLFLCCLHHTFTFQLDFYFHLQLALPYFPITIGNHMRLRYLNCTPNTCFTIGFSLLSNHLGECN